VIEPSQRPPPDDAQHSQKIFIHVPGGIRTRHPSKRATADSATTEIGMSQYYFLQIGMSQYYFLQVGMSQYYL
jgi:hypothetical protein